MTSTIDFLMDEPEGDIKATFIFAHGAGAAMDTHFMHHIARGLAAQGIQVLRFEFPYMDQRRHGGSKRPPDRQPKLLSCWQQALDQAFIKGPLFIGGKSMGGRMASILITEDNIPESNKPCAGLICLGYPFHPPGKPDKLRTEHLKSLTTPTLILQGCRDTMGTQEEVTGYTLSPAIDYYWLNDGDHSFKPRKKSGYTLEQNLDEAVAAIGAFIDKQIDA